jgi:hypothetical protein
MNRLLSATLVASSLLLGSNLGSGSTGAQDATNPILSLAGRWAGTATLVPASGPNELYSCVATYFPTDNGARVRQNLRCKSTNYQFDGATHLQIADGKISGRWQDKINNIDGTVSGSVKPNGFDIQLSGNFFDAKMSVASSPCQQSVTIVLEEGLPIKKIAAILKKC